MLITEKIAKMIEELLNNEDGTAEIRRNDFASSVGCVPSQINYVISSRFTREHGYIVESRRGGGGYIKITRVRMDKSAYLMHLYGAVGTLLDHQTAKAYLSSMIQNGIISEGQAKLFLSILSDSALEAASDELLKDMLRADIFKTIILNLM